MANDAAFLMRDIPRHRQRFQIHLRGHDRRSEAEHHSAFQILDGLGKYKEIVIAGFTGSGTVAIRMLVHNVVTETHMHGDRNRKPIRRGKYAEVAVGIRAVEDAATDVFSESQAQLSRFGNPVVEFGGFTPKAEFAGADIPSDAFGGFTDAGQLVIVNSSSAIHCDVSNETSFEEIDDMPIYAGAEDVGAHHQDAGRSPGFGSH